MKGPATQPPNRPNSCTYWVSDSLLAGEYPVVGRRSQSGNAAANADILRLQRYLDCGITYFLDLTQEGEKEEYIEALQKEAQAQGKSVQYKRLSIRDFQLAEAGLMTEILDTIDAAVAADDKVYVHCYGGVGRTGTVIGCYLVRHGNSGQQALEEVNRLFQSRSSKSFSSPDTTEQMDFIRNWNE